MDHDEQLFMILDAYKDEDITSVQAIHDIKLTMVDKLSAYIGDDYDNARKILVL